MQWFNHVTKCAVACRSNTSLPHPNDCCIPSFTGGHRPWWEVHPSAAANCHHHWWLPAANKSEPPPYRTGGHTATEVGLLQAAAALKRVYATDSNGKLPTLLTIFCCSSSSRPSQHGTNNDHRWPRHGPSEGSHPSTMSLPGHGP